MIIIAQYINVVLYYYSITSSDTLQISTFLVLLVAISTMLSEEYAKAYSKLEIMSQNLILANKIKDEFLINTSHEFKTPLHAIINISQSELNSYENNYKENLNYITAIATRLSNLVNDIIDFENLQNGDIRFDKKNFDISSVVQVIIEVLSYTRKDAAISLINKIPKGRYFIYADENRFKQILDNIIGNSLKYTEEGFVEVEAFNEGDSVCISVRDTGMGINEDIKDKLFKRSIQGDGKKFTDDSSSGLGLSISKLIANNMGGDIYLKHSELGKGSIFVIKLPKSTEYEQLQFDEEKPFSPSIAMNIKNKISNVTKVKQNNNNEENKIVTKYKILVVDDEPSNIKVLVDIFREEYYEILVAYNGEKALELIEVHKDISLVLLDVMLPDLSGYEVCRRIRTKYTLFELPILLLTVRNTPEDIEIGLKVGANDFLAKPFNYRELKARTKTLQKMQQSVKEAIRMETLFLQSQIKPHFLYNALSIIISLCYQDGERAGDLLGELSNYLRCTFDVDYNNSLVSLKREISLVKSYVELEKARFGQRLKVEFDIEDDILNYKVPPIIIQPIVENSIRHGLMKRIEGGGVKISIKNINNNIIIKIEDDGVGIEERKLITLLDNSITGSVGLKNVNKRLSNEYGQGLCIESKENLGTTVTMHIKLLEK
jgi:signal transduction histidine kinase